MGLLMSRLVAAFNKMEDKKIVMVGLDAAGKTTTLYRLKIGETATTIPTIGFNVEGIETANNLKLTVWDIGGQDRIRPLWRHYFQGSDAIIFVIDSADRTRILEAKEELDKCLRDDDIQNTCRAVLVFANKQDLPNAMTANEIMDKLGLRSLRANLKWYIQPTVATSGEGLYEGIEWLSKNIKGRK